MSSKPLSTLLKYLESGQAGKLSVKDERVVQSAVGVSKRTLIQPGDYASFVGDILADDFSGHHGGGNYTYDLPASVKALCKRGHIMISPKQLAFKLTETFKNSQPCIDAEIVGRLEAEATAVSAFRNMKAADSQLRVARARAEAADEKLLRTENEALKAEQDKAQKSVLRLKKDKVARAKKKAQDAAAAEEKASMAAEDARRAYDSAKEVVVAMGARPQAPRTLKNKRAKPDEGLVCIQPHLLLHAPTSVLRNLYDGLARALLQCMESKGAPGRKTATLVITKGEIRISADGTFGHFPVRRLHLTGVYHDVEIDETIKEKGIAWATSGRGPPPEELRGHDRTYRAAARSFFSQHSILSPQQKRAVLRHRPFVFIDPGEVNLLCLQFVSLADTLGSVRDVGKRRVADFRIFSHLTVTRASLSHRTFSKFRQSCGAEEHPYYCAQKLKQRSRGRQNYFQEIKGTNSLLFFSSFF
jgi:hypothetical protein